MQLSGSFDHGPIRAFVLIIDDAKPSHARRPSQPKLLSHAAQNKPSNGHVAIVVRRRFQCAFDVLSKKEIATTDARWQSTKIHRFGRCSTTLLKYSYTFHTSSALLDSLSQSSESRISDVQRSSKQRILSSLRSKSAVFS